MRLLVLANLTTQGAADNVGHVPSSRGNRNRAHAIWSTNVSLAVAGSGKEETATASETPQTRSASPNKPSCKRRPQEKDTRTLCTTQPTDT
jgi:hypothetical protein